MNGISSFTALRLARATAAVAAVAVLVVASGLVYLHATATTNDPWKSPQLLALKEQLRASPKDETIKARIRALDFEFRQGHARRLRLGAAGGWLLLGGTAVFVVALQAVVRLRRRLPEPRPDPQAAARAARRAARSRRAVAAAGVAAGAGLLAIGWNGQSRLVRPAADGAGTGPPAAALPPLPPPDEFARHWPRFRGPDGGAAAVEREAPLRWDATTGAGLAWKAEVPLPGFNSPIVWDGRVFVSGATKTSRAVFCYDAVTGSLLWNCALPAPAGPGVKPPDLAEDTGYAAPTLATDGRHVYAIFAHGDLTALTLAGRVAWTRMLGVPRNPYGHAASLAVWEGNVIVQFDQGDTEAPRSRLLAFDGATGRPRWETARPVGSSWATPVVADVAGRAQIVTLGEPWVIGYAAADGSELWRARVLDGEIAPSPIVAGGLILAVSPWQALIAIKPDGTGDVTATHVAWRTEAGVPDTSSPVSDGTRAYVVNNGGELICFNLKDGAQAWVQELGQGAHASPAIFGRRLYVICTDGTTVVAESGPAYRELARNPLGEDVQASPALAGGRLYVRGVRHLFCLGAAAGPVAATP